MVLALVENVDNGRIAERGITTANNRIEVVTPLPLEDLMFMVEEINNGLKSDELTVLGRGHFGKVVGYKNFAIKYVAGGSNSYNGYGDYNRSGNELLDAYVLKQLQSVESIPRLYAVVDDNAIIIEKINGMTMQQYKTQMEDSNKMDNFISVDFVEAHKEAMKDILMQGLVPHDLHMENVMIDKNTGLPKIIDVGLFKRMEVATKKGYAKDRESIDFRNFYSVDDAVSYAKRMQKYIEMKKDPSKLEAEKERLIREEEERKEMQLIRRENGRKRAIKLKAEDENLVKKNEYRRFHWRNETRHNGDVKHYVHRQHNNHDNKKEHDGVMVWAQKNIKQMHKDREMEKILREQEERLERQRAEYREWMRREEERNKLRRMQAPYIDVYIMAKQQRFAIDMPIFKMDVIEPIKNNQWNPDQRFIIKKNNVQYAMKE